MAELSLTEAAASRIREQLEQRGRGLGIRLQVKPTGCSGWMYQVEYADDQAPDDVRVEHAGAVLLVPTKSLPALNGTVVDFVGDGFSKRWQFNNPNVEADCGCGESFALRDSAASR